MEIEKLKADYINWLAGQTVPFIGVYQLEILFNFMKMESLLRSLQ